MFTQSDRFSNVDYAIRGPLAKEAIRMSGKGEEIIKLNIGNPALYGFSAPESMVHAVCDALRTNPLSHGYTESSGLPLAVDALHGHYQDIGEHIARENIFIGNGSSELISTVLLVSISKGDVVHLPTPDYPLWTAAISYSEGEPCFYACDESAGWAPNIEKLRAQITSKSKALVIINPNNPTGAVYDQEIIQALYELAVEHNLIIFSDEIYHGITYDNCETPSLAAICKDTVCFRFSGIAKRYRAAGLRVGWVTVSGKTEDAQELISGINIMGSLRLCANVPVQYAVPHALKDTSIDNHVAPSGRLYKQRETVANLLNKIPGVSCVKAKGAFYVFPKFNAEALQVLNDEDFFLEFLRTKKVLLIHGSGFHYPKPNHFRVVFLADVEILTKALNRFAEFIEEKQKDL